MKPEINGIYEIPHISSKAPKIIKIITIKGDYLTYYIWNFKQKKFLKSENLMHINLLKMSTELTENSLQKRIQRYVSTKN